MSPEFDHIFLDPQVFGKAEDYRGRPGGPREYPKRERADHAKQLLGDIQTVVQEAAKIQQKHKAESLPTMQGVRMEFTGQPGYPLPVKKLESPSSGVYLLNTREVVGSDGLKTIAATVLFPPSPPGKPNAYFADKVEAYRDENTENRVTKEKTDTPRHDPLIRCIEKIAFPTLPDFWFDNPPDIPKDEARVWCEIWVNRPYQRPKRRQKTNSVKKAKSKPETLEDIVKRFQTVCNQVGIECRSEHLSFPEQLVFLAKADGKQLENLVNAFDMLSAINLYREPSTFWLDLRPKEQLEWIDDLQSRLTVNQTPTCSICVLDTGVNNGHPLLQRLIPDNYRHTTKLDGNVGDHQGNASAHGTGMCGIAAFGDLGAALETQLPIHVNHAIESVKVLHENEENPEKSYGHITHQAVLLAEAEAPHFARTICMAITSEGTNDGSPSAWSAVVDQLACGDDEEAVEDKRKRLIVLSAGNVNDSDDWANYPVSNESAAIEDPAQSWNALTVGAYTTKCQITEIGTDRYETVAKSGELSPFSRTSVAWSKGWPLKPDIVLEGGNLSKSPQNEIADHESLALLTTSHDWNTRNNHFAPFVGTSPASAQAAYFAASVFTAYPEAWPETVRGVLVHSARWTDAMISPRKLRTISKTNLKNLVQQVGFGVPNLPRSLRTLSNRITMVIQDDSLRPYQKGGSSNKYNNIKLFELPWPKQELLHLGEIETETRVTLSYFVSPSPGRKGWGSQYRYPSHTLRFEMNSSGEDRETFFNRIVTSVQAGDDVIDGEEDEEKNASAVKTSSVQNRWKLGSQSRNHGSIHTDFWRDTAASMADCRYIAVYPGTGWWKERPQFGMDKHNVRYSLIVTLEVFADTTIKNHTEVPINLYAEVEAVRLSMIEAATKVKNLTQIDTRQ